MIPEAWRFMMQRCRVFVCSSLLLVLPCASVVAKPTDDVSGWLQRFGQAVLSNKSEMIANAMREIADPRLNIGAIEGAVSVGLHAVGDQAPEYVERFDEENVGNFAKRVGFAVRYNQNFLFYKVTLERDAQGWQLVQFNIEGSLEKILHVPWPN